MEQEKQKATQERSDRDGAWKDAIARFLPHLLRRTLPELYADMDKRKKPEFLSKELRDTLQKPAAKRHNAARFVDMLIKIPMKSGESKWVWLHIEIQGSGGEDISYRMTLYCCLIFSHYQVMPTALAILTSPRPKGEVPGHYESLGYGTRLSYEYNCFAVYDQDDGELLGSDNPFDLIIYTAKKEALFKGKNREEKKFRALRELTRLLSEKGWNERDRRDLLILIARMINLQDRELQRQYVEEMKGEGKMATETFIEKYFREEALAEGRTEGARQEKESIAIKMLKAGKLALEEIADYSGLTLAKVKTLQRKAV